MEVEVQRIPVTDSTKYIKTSREKVTLILSTETITLITRLDTLELTRTQLYKSVFVYKDRYNQKYHVVFDIIRETREFSFRFTPMLPHKRNKLYAINLKNI